MFRATRKHFSLRDSPSESLNGVSSPLRQRILALPSSNSPAKRLKLNEPVQLMSSTFLREKTGDGEGKAEWSADDTIRTSFVETDQSSHLDVTIANSVDTPPPTPEVLMLSRMTMLAKQKSKLLAESAELDQEIDNQFKEFTGCTAQVAALKAVRYKYEDFSTILTRSAKDIRNRLNQIFQPGNELVQRFEATMREMQASHKKKFEKKSLEWNSSMDKTKTVVASRVAELKHEMDLHRRTLAHHEHNNNILEDVNDLDRVTEEAEGIKETEEVGGAEVEAPSPSPDSIKKDPINLEDEIQGDNTDDCIILDGSEDPNVGREEIVTESSVQNSENKADLDGDETDLDDNNDDESRSFTPCQAQRVN